MIAESGRGGDLNRAARRDFDRRVDDVLFPIAFAGGNIAGQRVAGQCRDCDVVSASDTALEHAAAPNRDLAGGIGRAHNIAVSALPGNTLPGDVSASKRYWEEDVIDPPVEVSPRGTIQVP